MYHSMNHSILEIQDILDIFNFRNFAQILIYKKSIIILKVQTCISFLLSWMVMDQVGEIWQKDFMYQNAIKDYIELLFSKI